MSWNDNNKPDISMVTVICQSCGMTVGPMYAGAYSAGAHIGSSGLCYMRREQILAGKIKGDGHDWVLKLK